MNLAKKKKERQKSIKKGTVLKHMIFSEFNSRCRVVLTSIQSKPDKGYKIIMEYQDYLTKSLMSKKVEYVAYWTYSHFFKLHLHYTLIS